MNHYCECANKATMEDLEKYANFFFAVNKRGDIVCIKGCGGATPVYRSEYNGEEVTVFASNSVPHERNK